MKRLDHSIQYRSPDKLKGHVIMHTFLTILAYAATCILAIIACCWAHSSSGSKMARAKFIVIGLLVLAAIPAAYFSLWSISGQQPSFLLNPAKEFSMTMLVLAIGYCVVFVLSYRRFNAPSTTK